MPMKTFLTLAELADHTVLLPEYLAQLGVSELRGAICIQYRLADGREATRSQMRKAKIARDGSKWLAGDGKPGLYGLWRLSDARNAAFVVFVTGESDCWTLWYHGFPALGFPGRGAQMTQRLELADLDDIPEVVIVRESADDATAFIRGIQARLKTLSWHGRIRVLQMPDGVKDPNDLHKLDPVNFKEQFRRLLDYASDVESPTSACSTVILDAAPQRMARPLCLIGDHAYAAAWPWVGTTSGDQAQQALVVIRDDGATFTDGPRCPTRDH
jgi:putative DNA primase/helicase